jgi:hypothetical protein
MTAMTGSLSELLNIALAARRATPPAVQYDYFTVRSSNGDSCRDFAVVSGTDLKLMAAEIFERAGDGKYYKR